jgi:beta-glucanase (GH16 family)
MRCSSCVFAAAHTVSLTLAEHAQPQPAVPERVPPALPGNGRWEATLVENFEQGFNASLWTKGWAWCNGTGTEPGLPQPRTHVKASDTCYFADDNVAVTDGKLVLTNKREKSHGFDYTSGVVNSIAYPGRGFQQLYGYFEARIQPSPGEHNVGMCPAFWMPNVRNNGDDGNCEIDGAHSAPVLGSCVAAQPARSILSGFDSPVACSLLGGVRA